MIVRFSMLIASFNNLNESSLSFALEANSLSYAQVKILLSGDDLEFFLEKLKKLEFWLCFSFYQLQKNPHPLGKTHVFPPRSLHGFEEPYLSDKNFHYKAKM